MQQPVSDFHRQHRLGLCTVPAQDNPHPAAACASPLPLPLPGAPRVLSLPPRQPWLPPCLLPPAPRTPGSAAASSLPVGSRPRGAPQLQTWKPPAALGLRALLGGEKKERRSGGALRQLLAKRLQFITASLCPFSLLMGFLSSPGSQPRCWRSKMSPSLEGGLFILT